MQKARTEVSKSPKKIAKLRIKNSYIPWSFPEIVAVHDDLFGKEGLNVELYTLKASDVEPSDKINWYKSLVENGKVDAYSCCAWAALDRLGEGGKKKIVGATSSTNYAFSIFVKKDSKIRDVEGLRNVEVLVNLKTGSHYCNLRQLEEVIPYQDIKLVHGGAPHTRLLALMEGKAEAAALISPYSEIATDIGLHKVFETNTVDVLAFIAKTELTEGLTTALLRVLNEAIRRVKKNPEKYRPLYLKVLRETLRGYPVKYKTAALKSVRKLEKQLPVVQWSELKPYAKETFDTIEKWMTSHSLLESDVSYDSLVNNQPIRNLISASD